jgi:hypothetical protein
MGRTSRLDIEDDTADSVIPEFLHV